MFGPQHPLRYQLSKNFRQTRRTLSNFIHASSFSTRRLEKPLGVEVLRSRSPFFRDLPQVPRRLFENKRVNLSRALDGLNGILIRPGEVFSFWWLVGAPDVKRGFLEGLVIRQGRAETGFGGGLCQLSNMIHYLVLHSDVKVMERHRHSFDLFPDDARTVPFGIGATVSYNYKDLRFLNKSAATYQLIFELDETHLSGRLLCDREPEKRYCLKERDCRVTCTEGVYWRENEVYREVADERDKTVVEEVLFRNRCECRYIPREVMA